MQPWIELEQIDALPVRNTTIDDIDFKRVERHLRMARNVADGDPVEYLRNRSGLIDIAGTLVPSLGGLVCFGHQPQRHLSYTGIALTRYTGATPDSEQVIDIRDLRGTLFEMIDEADAYLWAQSNHGFKIESSPRRMSMDQYPRIAIRELIVNSVAHRDYRVVGSRVKVEMFRNQIEWSSPGGLPPGVTVENILKAQYSRNPVIVSFLWDAGYIEQRGMGLDTVVRSLTSEGLPYPQMEDTGASFLIRIEGHGSVDKHQAMGLSEPLAQVYTLVETSGATGIGAKIIAERLGIPTRTVNNRLRELIEKGLVTRQGATNMTRYLIVEHDS
jgi:ATP-dependent DNA helicase RecG